MTTRFSQTRQGTRGAVKTACAALLCAVGLMLSGKAMALQQCAYMLSAGHPGLTEFAVASQISRSSSEMICALESKGSLENLYNLLNDRRVIGGVVQSDIVRGAVRERPKKLSALEVVLTVERALGHVIVRADNSFQSLSDLGSDVVCTGTEASGTYFTFLQMKAALGAPWVEANEPFAKCLDLLDRGSVDAVFTLAAPPIPALKGKVWTAYRLLDIPSLSEYTPATVTHYEDKGKAARAIDTFSVDLVFLVRKDVIGRDGRLRDKLTAGLADAVSRFPAAQQDRICSKGFQDYGMPVSRIHRKACSMGFFGKDW